MKELSIEEKAKAYDEALKVLHKYDGANIMFTQDLKEEMFPELKESENEGIRKSITEFFKNYSEKGTWKAIPDVTKWIAWLERQSEQKPSMIQWTGDNLKDVIEFTGKYKEFDKWFRTWYDYECYVHSHDNIFKLFNEDGIHIEVPVGAWIVKTPDGYNTASRYVFKQKPTWSEKDEAMIEIIINDIVVIKERTCCKNVCDEEINWLESLKDRVQLKQEWSEEDEEEANYIADFIENLIKKEKLVSKKTMIMKEMVDWLRSLRPPYYCDNCKLKKSIQGWKPSKLQLDCLSDAIEKYNKEGYKAPILCKLLEQLKKL